MIAATKVYAYEVGKAAPDFEPRPEVWRASYALEQRARAEIQNSNWLARLAEPYPASAPRAFVGALAAGEKIISSKQSSNYQLLRTHYGDALAVEMEGHGFLQAVRANHSVQALVIRGISDLIDKKADADASGSQPLAAQHAAAFAFEVLARFTLPRAGPEQKWKPPLHRPLRAEHFIDREEEQSWLQGQLKLGKAVTLCGPGGMGKTALIAEVIWKLFPDNIPPESFPDGLIFHSFYQQPEATVALEQIARIFGEDPLPTPTSAAQRALNGRKVLLVFDGAEEADDLRHVMAVCAGQGVLIASRRRADATDLQFFRDLFPLPVEHAVAVIQAWSQEQAGSEPILQQICRLVGNLPLALRLVGRYLALHHEEMEVYLQWLEESPLAAF